MTDEEDNNNNNNTLEAVLPQRLSSTIIEQQDEKESNSNNHEVELEVEVENKKFETTPTTSTSTMEDGIYLPHLTRRRYEDDMSPTKAVDSTFQHLGIHQYQRPGLTRLKRVMGPTVLSWFIPFTLGGSSLEEVHHSICGIGNNKVLVFIFRNMKSCAGLFCSKSSRNGPGGVGYERI